MKTLVRILPLFLGCVMVFSGCATSRHKTTKAQAAMSLIEATAQLAEERDTRLHPNYIWATLKDHEQDAKINAAFQRALAKDNCKSRIALLRAVELKFIHDPNASGLDILGPELSYHFRSFAWDEADFPGGKKGPNESFADVMVDTLDLVLPERRANSSRDAVVLKAEVNDAVWGLITNKWTTVPGQERWKLNPRALESFVRMREAAKLDGVDLIISSSHRYPETAARNAARAGNPNAVASFSSHSLGLAIDFQLSHRNEFETKEGSTGSMSAMVHMRQSPVHKWLVLHGEKYSWYPYQNEPWHWEYNPPGFREIFWADFPGGAPQREIMIDEP